MNEVPEYECDIEKLKRKNPFFTNTMLVYTFLRNNITEHRIRPGQRLNQEQIAIDLDVSRTPVRDAFAMLEKEGFLEKAQQSYSVYEMHAGDYMMLLDVRVIHEVLAATLACSRMREQEKKLIEQNLVLMDRVLAEAEQKAWDSDYQIKDQKLAGKYMNQLSELDHIFHNLLMSASHNQYLIDSYRQLDPKIHFFRHFAFNVSAAQNMKDRHRMIYEAIRSRDEMRAERYMKNHLQLTLNRAVRY